MISQKMKIIDQRSRSFLKIIGSELDHQKDQVHLGDLGSCWSKIMIFSHLWEELRKSASDAALGSWGPDSRSPRWYAVRWRRNRSWDSIAAARQQLYALQRHHGRQRTSPAIYTLPNARQFGGRYALMYIGFKFLLYFSISALLFF